MCRRPGKLTVVKEKKLKVPIGWGARGGAGRLVPTTMRGTSKQFPAGNGSAKIRFGDGLDLLLSPAHNSSYAVTIRFV
ncbi:hypothetical protein DPPLL_24660 [Desulfofustis limnaeus]|uniref:Uncharacterized protein n=1 Tax=Desulfofustis limnaeus TaxID=2740163 RepID=A0ABN6M8K8_9BACT|nr:hypothetical protein DPPLL_24660 [Desulfofustis limnaeus]